jgi:hypothetical protein
MLILNIKIISMLNLCQQLAKAMLAFHTVCKKTLLHCTCNFALHTR